MRRALLLVAGVLLAVGGGLLRTEARPPLGFAYCDLDRLYDTIPSPFYRDADYTPDGALRWNTARYERKIAQAAVLIDSMALPLVALFGVENEAVVRDLSAACTSSYTYLHRTLNRLDGLDFALLYYADCFFPHSVETGNSYLYIEGTVAERFGGGDRDAACDAPPCTLGLLLCRDERMACLLPELLREEHPGVRLLVMGRFDPADCRRAGRVEATARAERAGRGNRFRQGGWEMRDRVAADSTLRIGSCDVFVREWLLDPATGQPLPTYRYRTYRGGYGSTLPIFGYIRFP